MFDYESVLCSQNIDMAADDNTGKEEIIDNSNIPEDQGDPADIPEIEDDFEDDDSDEDLDFDEDDFEDEEED